MIRLYTLGFTKKSAEDFFRRLTAHGVKRVIDVRLRPASQLSGFAKGRDLGYFLKKLAGADYLHCSDLCPTPEMLDEYQDKKLSFGEYAERYRALLKSRGAEGRLTAEALDGACLLCSEATEEKCHRLVAAEYLREHFPNLQIQHL